MKPRLLLWASFIAIFAPLAAAQQIQTEQGIPPSAGQAPKAKPRPKPAVHKKPAPAAATSHEVSVKAHLLQKIKDWSVFIYEDENGRVCFAATPPTEMQPKAVKRSPVIFYVTTWQKDGVRDEVSIKLGYTMKPKSAAIVTAGGQHFTLTSDEDKAYAKDPAEERKLLDAMAAGGAMIVKATSAKGTATTDQFSLEGAAAAVQKLQDACP